MLSHDLQQGFVLVLVAAAHYRWEATAIAWRKKLGKKVDLPAFRFRVRAVSL